MPNPIAHFSINADDVPKTMAFYQNVFAWKFNSWGPPGFYMIDMGETRPMLGSLQQRRQLVPGRDTIGFECSIAVEDVNAVAAAVEKHGGRIVMPKVTIAGVGWLIWFEDPSGNVAGAMQYDAAAE